MPKTVIQLGRAGDILTILPVLQQHPEQYEIMVSKDYAQIVEAQTIVKSIIYPGPAWEVGKAVEQCKLEGREWVCTQVNCARDAVEEFVWKPNNMTGSTRTSFQKDMYRALGRLHEWDNNYPLEFDRRDSEREAKLVKLLKPKKKYVLAALDGISSPFPYKPLLLHLLKYCGFSLLDISKLQAARIYDLLALYEHPQVVALVAIDSAPLQLARAVPRLPVFALANDTPLLWFGSSWRPNHWWYCRYKDFPFRAVEMLEQIREVSKFRYKTFDGAKVIHFWNAYEGESCERPADWFWPLPITIGSCGRDSASHLKDPKRLPYLRDSLRMALQRAEAQDWVCLTRPNVLFETKAAEAVCQSKGPAYAYRMKAFNGGATFFPIADMFFAKREVWKSMLPEIPDLVLGSDYFWSHALTALFRVKGAYDLTGSVYTNAAPSAEDPAQ